MVFHTTSLAQCLVTLEANNCNNSALNIPGQSWSCVGSKVSLAGNSWYRELRVKKHSSRLPCFQDSRNWQEIQAQSISDSSWAFKCCIQTGPSLIRAKCLRYPALWACTSYGNFELSMLLLPPTLPTAFWCFWSKIFQNQEFVSSAFMFKQSAEVWLCSETFQQLSSSLQIRASKYSSTIGSQPNSSKPDSQSWDRSSSSSTTTLDHLI